MVSEASSFEVNIPRCPLIGKNMIDLDEKSVSVASFDAKGLQEIEGSAAILAKVNKYLATLEHRQRMKSFHLREPFLTDRTKFAPNVLGSIRSEYSTFKEIVLRDVSSILVRR